MLPECVLIVGPSGCGKTHSLIKMLRTEKSGVYDYIFILCPTYSINQTYHYAQWNVNDPCVFGVEIMADKLEGVLNFVVTLFSGDRVAVVIDDMSNSTEQHLNHGKLSYLAYSGRHHGISMFLLSQKLSSVATGIRDNATRVLFFPTHSKRSLKTLRDEFFGNLDPSRESSLLQGLRSANVRYLDTNLAKRTQTLVSKHTPLYGDRGSTETSDKEEEASRDD